MAAIPDDKENKRFIKTIPIIMCNKINEQWTRLTSFVRAIILGVTKSNVVNKTVSQIKMYFFIVNCITVYLSGNFSVFLLKFY